MAEERHTIGLVEESVVTTRVRQEHKAYCVGTLVVDLRDSLKAREKLEGKKEVSIHSSFVS